MSIKKKTLIILVVVILAIIVVAHLSLTYLIRKTVFQQEFEYSEISKKELVENYTSEAISTEKNSFVPFKEIDAFGDDEEAHTWSTVDSHYEAGGMTIFDANGDGRLDIYMSKDGDSWVRASDDRGILESEPKYQRNMLYLNLGNNEEGHPIYKSINKVMDNDEYVEEELLVENFLFPRKKLNDSIKRKGRLGVVSVSSDFNGDGLPDLLIGNGLPGIFSSHEKNYIKIGGLSSPLDRKVVRGRRAVSSFAANIVEHEVKDDLHEVRESSKGIEAVGANVLLINKGDKDGDGIPEWEDVSKAAQIEGRGSTLSLAVADIDLDGDLDIYTSNIADPDVWTSSAKYVSGAERQMYINQIAETGELTFIESAKEMNISGAYNEANPIPTMYRFKKSLLSLSEEYSVLSQALFGADLEKIDTQPTEINGQKTVAAEFTWVTFFQDVNDDGYADLWIGNNFEYLKLYINENGKTFREDKTIARRDQKSTWMSFAPADYNSDLKEDIFVGSTGGAMSSLTIQGSLSELSDPDVDFAIAVEMLVHGTANLFHTMIDGSDLQNEFSPKINHSRVLPPDATLKNNSISDFLPKETLDKYNYSMDGLSPYEFSWGTTSFDVQNDGKMDFYYIGGNFGRGGTIASQVTANPGRLMVNTTNDSKNLSFVDLTAEHHLFNIEELSYDRLNVDGYIYRKAPTQNWMKRDTVNSYDVSTSRILGAAEGREVINQDMLQLAENGRAVVAADLNSDGSMDLVLRNLGGYDSRSSEAKNLKININGDIRALPAHDYVFPSPTNFEPGRSRVFINQYMENFWLKVKLIDDSPNSFNRDAIGAKIIVNNKYLKVKRSSSGNYISNDLTDVHFGLGDGTANHIVIEWPDSVRSKTELPLDSLKNGTLVISKQKGNIGWQAN